MPVLDVLSAPSAAQTERVLGRRGAFREEPSMR